MWILNWLPDWIFWITLLLALGIFGITYFLRFIPVPVLWTYKIPVQIASVIIIVFSVYMLGAQANEQAWQIRVKQAEARAEKAEALAQQKNVEIVEKVIYKDRIIKQQAEATVKYIDREIVKYNTRCEIPEEFTQTHNQAVKGLPNE